MAYKQPSGGPFKMMGSSPVKKETEYAKAVRENLMNKGKAHNNWGRPGYDSITGRPSNNMGLPKNFNTKGSKGSATPGHKTTKVAKTTKATLPKNFNAKGTSKAGKLAQLAKKTLSTNLVSGGKQVLKKAAKVIGGKTLGVAGMLMATSSKADQPKGKAKKKGSYTNDLTKLK